MGEETIGNGLESQVKMIIKDKTIDDRWFPAFCDVVNKLDLPILNKLLTYFIAFNLKGKNDDEVNDVLGMKSDLTGDEKKILGQFLDEEEDILFM